MSLGDLTVLTEIVDMAHDYSLETRIRRQLEDHWYAGDKPRTLVMNANTWKQLIWELGGRGYKDGYWWTNAPEAVNHGQQYDYAFLGLPILIKDFMPDQEVIIGV